MPHLTALAQEGLTVPLRTLKPTSSPFLWNAIYTGFTPGLHRLRPTTHTPSFRVRIRDRDRVHVPDALDGLSRLAGNAAGPRPSRGVGARAVYASDRLRVGMARTALETSGPRRFLFAYIRGVDVAQHAYWHLHEAS